MAHSTIRVHSSQMHDSHKSYEVCLSGAMRVTGGLVGFDELLQVCWSSAINVLVYVRSRILYFILEGTDNE